MGSGILPLDEVPNDIFQHPNQDDERHHGKTKSRDPGGIKLIITFSTSQIPQVLQWAVHRLSKEPCCEW